MVIPPAQRSEPKHESPEEPNSIDNIARFFGAKGIASKPGAMARPAMDVIPPTGDIGLKKGQRVRHAKYGEGTVLLREGEGEDAKLTVRRPAGSRFSLRSPSWPPG